MAHIQVSTEITDQDVLDIVKATKAGPVYIVHSSCSTFGGRKKISMKIKQSLSAKGHDCECVQSFGWATTVPDGAKVPSPEPTIRPHPVVLADEEPVHKRNRHRQGKKNA